TQLVGPCAVAAHVEGQADASRLRDAEGPAAVAFLAARPAVDEKDARHARPRLDEKASEFRPVDGNSDLPVGQVFAPRRADVVLQGCRTKHIGWLDAARGRQRRQLSGSVLVEAAALPRGIARNRPLLPVVRQHFFALLVVIAAFAVVLVRPYAAGPVDDATAARSAGGLDVRPFHLIPIEPRAFGDAARVDAGADLV